MKSFLIMIIAAAACAYAAYNHFSGREVEISAAVTKKTVASDEAAKTRVEVAALDAEVSEKKATLERDLVEIPKRELAEARAVEAKRKAEAQAELDAAKLAAAESAKVEPSPELADLRLQCETLDAAFTKLDAENIRLRPIVEAEKAAARPSSSSKKR